MKILDNVKGNTLVLKKYDIPHKGDLTINNDGSILVEYKIEKYEKIGLRERLNEGMSTGEKFGNFGKVQLQKNGLKVAAKIGTIAATSGTAAVPIAATI